MSVHLAMKENMDCSENGQCVLGNLALHIQISIAPLVNKFLKAIMFGSCVYLSQHLVDSQEQRQYSINQKYLLLSGRVSGLLLSYLIQNHPYKPMLYELQRPTHVSGIKRGQSIEENYINIKSNMPT